MVLGVEVMVADKCEEVGSGVVVVDEALVDVYREPASVVFRDLSFCDEFFLDTGYWVFAEFAENCFWLLDFGVDV